MTRFIPPRTDEERQLEKKATEFLRDHGCGADGLPCDRSRARLHAEYRRRTVLTPCGGTNGHR